MAQIFVTHIDGSHHLFEVEEDVDLDPSKLKTKVARFFNLEDRDFRLENNVIVLSNYFHLKKHNLHKLYSWHIYGLLSNFDRFLDEANQINREGQDVLNKMSLWIEYQSEQEISNLFMMVPYDRWPNTVRMAQTLTLIKQSGWTMALLSERQMGQFLSVAPNNHDFLELFLNMFDWVIPKECPQGAKG